MLAKSNFIHTMWMNDLFVYGYLDESNAFLVIGVFLVRCKVICSMGTGYMTCHLS